MPEGPTPPDSRPPDRGVRWRTHVARGLKYLAFAGVAGAAVFYSAHWSLEAWSGFETKDPATQALAPCQPQPGLGPEMVRIPGGRFTMGSPETEPERVGVERQHEVEVETFAIGRCQVTFAEYDAFAEATGGEMPDDGGWGRGRRPVINVSWDDATAYAQWLSEQTGQEYRLPTEAEWEYAARAGSTTAFWWGDTIHTDQANYDGRVAYNDGPTGEYRGQTVPVGQFEANAFGLYDVHGNVWEWTCSFYDRDYAGGETRCAEPGSEGRRVLRGGSWDYEPWWLRSAYRSYFGPANRVDDVGFRLARAVP
jgi:formylglycine-generating enzyme required for sulfatase activity